MTVGFGKRLLFFPHLISTLFILCGLLFSAASAANVPSDSDQDILIKTSLMTFNDANMTGNYAVFVAKAAKEFQAQVTAEKLGTSFEGFRKNELFFESVVTDEYESSEKAKIDSEGALILAGVFKGEEMRVKYRLRYLKNGNAWKLLGINVDATRL